MGLDQYEFRIFIDGKEYGSYDYITNSEPDHIRVCTTYGSYPFQPYDTYFDAVGFSWDTGYNVGDNIIQESSLNVQVDMQIDDVDLYFIHSLSYSYKTNVSALITFDVWNWKTLEWFEIQNCSNYLTFDDDRFFFYLSSDYVNSTNGMRFRFQCINIADDFQLEIDQFRLNYYHNES